MAKTNHLGAGAFVAGVLVAVGMLALMLVVEARPAEATFPGKNGNIAYAGYDGQDYEIYTINPGGGARVQLTQNDTYDFAPSYSANGRGIAYSALTPHTKPGQNIDIYTMDPARGGPGINISDNGDNCSYYVVRSCDSHSPSYSPDGTKIVYDGHTEGGAEDIYTINNPVAETSRVQLTNGPANDRHASYSPDGKKIAFDSKRSGNIQIYTMNADGTGGPVQLTQNAKNALAPSYSPNGQKIAYAGYDGQDYEIYTMNADGTGTFQVTHNNTDDSEPSYSPDGQKIAYSGYDDVVYPGHAAASKDYEIYTINADGGGTRVKLTNNDTNDFAPSWGSSPVVGIKPPPPPHLARQ